jgi:DNA-binding LacI/PurR family transcriptional regulator
LYLVDRHSGQEAEFYRGLASARRVDGFILTDSLVGDTRFELMRSLGLTAVLIGTPWIDDPVPHVDTDDPGAGIAESVEHLVALGHRRLAYVGGPADRVPAVRRRGAFEKTLAAAGLTSVATITTNYSTESAAQRTRELLDLACPPTAVLYGTDEMAIAGLRTAKMCGVRVPEDLSVIGFDGLPLGEWMDPQLTTVRRDVVERGRAAAAVLLRLLGETVEGDYPLTYPQLVLRGSTAPPPQDD